MENVEQGQAESQTGQTTSTDASQGNAHDAQSGNQPSTTTQRPAPFASGKEKFIVNGKEEEWDFETAKKYAQVGNAGYKALEEASKIKKAAEKAYREMVEAARKDPNAFIRMFNENYQPQASQPGKENEQQELDPRDLKIQELERKLQPLASKIEQQEIAEERKAYENERAEALKKYPRLNSLAAQSYLESEYIKNLKALDEPLPLEDIAFAVDQELAREESEREKSKLARVEQNQRRAPVSTSPAGEAPKKGMTLDDVKRLAGRL